MVYGSVCHRLKLAFTLFISFSSWKLVFPLMMYKKGRRINVVAKKKSFCVQYYMEHTCLYESLITLSLSSVFDTDWWSHFPMKCSHHSKSTHKSDLWSWSWSFNQQPYPFGKKWLSRRYWCVNMMNWKRIKSDILFVSNIVNMNRPYRVCTIIEIVVLHVNK